MPVEPDAEAREVLDYTTVAVVGCSLTSGKDAVRSNINSAREKLLADEDRESDEESS